MEPTIEPGVVFLPMAPGAHHRVVLSHPTEECDEVLLVNWTTFGNTTIDKECILDIGDHPDIQHKSTMAYSRAKMRSSEKIANAIEQGAFSLRDRVTPDVLQRIILGACRSAELSPECKELLPCPEPNPELSLD